VEPGVANDLSDRECFFIGVCKDEVRNDIFLPYEFASHCLFCNGTENNNMVSKPEKNNLLTCF